MKVRHGLVAAGVIGLSAGAASAQEVVRIGHVGPISGAQAHYGKENEVAARMAVDDLNAKGVTLGGKKVRIELVAEDDAADPKQGTAAAQKLCDMKVNGVVGHANSGTTLPASTIYHQCGIPHITPSATNPRITELGYKTTFRMLANDNALGAGLAQYAADTLKLKRIAIVDDRTAYGQGIASVFRKTALAKGMQVVEEQFTTDKATDFSAILTAIKAKSPDAVFFGGMDPQGGPMLRQMAQLGMTTPKFLGGDGLCSEKLPELAGGAKTLANVICAEGGASLDKMPGGRAWKADYDRKYPGVFVVYAPYAYDAVQVLVTAMQAADSSDPKVYLPKLATVQHKGVTSNVSFDAHGDLKNPSITLYVYKDGKKTPLN